MMKSTGDRKPKVVGEGSYSLESLKRTALRTSDVAFHSFLELSKGFIRGASQRLAVEGARQSPISEPGQPPGIEHVPDVSAPPEWDDFDTWYFGGMWIFFYNKGWIGKP